jgi:tRNA-splicing ligase RtcB
MYEINAKECHVKVHAQIVDEACQGQIVQIANHPAVHGLIAIMPDCHAGAGCVIGFTGRFKDAVIPNVVGVDIGCGISMVHIGKMDVDFEAFDKFVRKTIPLGFHDFSKPGAVDGSSKRLIGKGQAAAIYLAQDVAKRIDDPKKYKDPASQMGTLGGGNHFIEINVDRNGEYWLTVHSGSRNFGLRVANYHQKKAVKITKQMGVNVPKGLEYLPMVAGGTQYMEDMTVAQIYALANRGSIIRNLLPFFGKSADDRGVVPLVSTHNYISETDGVVRKGAIRAVKGEIIAIPLNMADGIVLAYGKSNKDYNNSAPHGAGRLYGRAEMKRRLADGKISVDGFKEKMKDVFSTCVDAGFIDESPMAYKSFDDIKAELEETVEIIDIMKPVYNIKA